MSSIVRVTTTLLGIGLLAALALATPSGTWPPDRSPAQTVSQTTK